MQQQERIARFQKMIQADPDNELGHLSLGQAYLEAEQYDEAAASLRRVVEINAQASRAYQLLAEAQRKQGRPEDAVETLRVGYRVAEERGDLTPRDEMRRMLEELGQPVPEIPGRAVAAEEPSGGAIRCRRCGRVGQPLPDPPFRGDLGKEVQAHICADCWREWIGMGTMVINELGLDLTDPQAQEVYDRHMKEFLGL